MKEITVQELKEKKENGVEFLLIDVRENTEYLVSNLDGQHIPLGELPNRLDEINADKDAEVIMMCRSGGRSGRAVGIMESNGFTNVHNLKGGITAWSNEIDPSLPVA